MDKCADLNDLGGLTHAVTGQINYSKSNFTSSQIDKRKQNKNPTRLSQDSY